MNSNVLAGFSPLSLCVEHSGQAGTASAIDRCGPSRRRFLQTTALLGALGMSAMPALARPIAPARKGLRILILGGTGFLGPAVVEAAKARGHAITLFNRGKTEKRRGVIEDVEKLHGNRDPKLRADDSDPESPQGLSELKGKSWDAVVDTSGYFPRIVRASAEALKDSVKRYLFISTVSVYAGNEKANADESDALGSIAMDAEETMGGQMENYGPFKARCEEVVSEVFGSRATNIRPGFIVGPGDPTDRFTYWPVRAQACCAGKGTDAELLVPGEKSDPVQIIDVRDLGEFIITCLEQDTGGTFNAVGPEKTYTTGQMVEECLAACKQVAGGACGTTPVWVPAEFLDAQGVQIGGDLPILIPPLGDSAGFHQRSNAAAVNAGLKFRPVKDTCVALLEWWPKEQARRNKVRTQMVEEATKAGKPVPPAPQRPLTELQGGMDRARELEILKAWREKKG